ncbi:Protein DEFECTIVE IN MERISTEM SILENCING 3 [Camellia lanceoleosa]|uniref:Protein DEFECTIVE IN MERISTEM SILENCING 3 n=1 Tax=Camellia lanceoleosa TaxID=1840588 RepID=A0ACC0H693_9ERIC|nr:Protein DEFECTIVE IN MERISTEM SILENCING 3 [Camellia lanceoleosa]
MPMMEDEDHTGVDSEEEPLEHIIGHKKSAAGILCLLKTCHGNEASNLLLTKDVLGIVATLGKVDDDNLSRLLSEYLGIETMLAVVCKSYNGVNALETYGNDGSVSKSSGLHGLGTSIGRHLDGHFQVICLENLRFIKLFVASVADHMCRSGAVDLICVDSVSALTPQAEIEVSYIVFIFKIQKLTRLLMPDTSLGLFVVHRGKLECSRWVCKHVS